jgi:hypothetical protein
MRYSNISAVHFCRSFLPFISAVLAMPSGFRLQITASARCEFEYALEWDCGLNAIVERG